jgi:hypothetical protein
MLWLVALVKAKVQEEMSALFVNTVGEEQGRLRRL